MSEPQYRLLFVDGDPKVIKTLRRVLHKMRDEWDMAFAGSMADALQQFKEKRFDVIVSCMRLPKMDGMALLTEVQKRYPETVRIILSGYAKQEHVLKTVGPAHQYLAKPCDPGLLIQTIQRALDLRTMLKSKDLQRMVAGVRNLPTPARIFSDLLKEIDSPEGSAAALAKIIERDVAMTAEILKLTNSAYFGLESHVTSPLQAVRLLGFETVKALVLMSGIFKKFSGNAGLSHILRTLSMRSVSIGALAKAICQAERMDQTVVDQACCAGVVSHVGTLLLVAQWPVKYKEAIDLINDGECGIIEAERQVFGASHPRVGGYLLGLWGFNDPIVEAVAYHHEPHRNDIQTLGPLAVVHAAQHLIRSESATLDVEESLPSTFDRDYLEQVGVLDRLPVWQKLVPALKHWADA